MSPVDTSSEKNFKCEICCLSFSKRGYLTKHVKNIHNEAKEYTCDLCGVVLKTKFAYSNHIKIVHKGVKQFKCDYCGKSFGQKVTLPLTRHY